MRTTVNLDDALFEKASVLTGVSERGMLLKEALKALIERESSKRLALLGGSEPKLEAPPRRRSE
ncbi:type II toxin-antitoxin system VapB family antitoxin [Sedimentitalea todarodis]|uniref:type II toxin-antitoxin system VapB family antitoxin n=1 Tax=Sedimentitalea todarodis TaxID=1631240 RepID=UPI0037431E9B